MAKKIKYTKDFASYLETKLECMKDEFQPPVELANITVKFPDGSSRETSITDTLLALSYVDVSDSGELIFGFSSEDYQKWKTAEIKLKDLNKLFPNFADILEEKMEPFSGLNTTEIIKNIKREYDEKIELEAENAKRQSEQHYSKNPFYGRF